MSRNDNVFFDISRDDAVERDLGKGNDTVAIGHDSSVSQIRLTFTSSEVGNDDANDSDSMANQDGGLAVRVRAESATGTPRGPTSRFDDEGITFTTRGTATFDVRDLVSGAARGDMFDVVRLGTDGADNLIAGIRTNAYYMNGGAGDDRLFGGFMNDFLVGGSGNDFMSDRWGDNNFIGGAGNDLIFSGDGDDTVTVNLATDGRDKAELGGGLDTVKVAAPASAGQIRLSFTSSEVGNGNARDSNSMTGQDGSLAVRMEAENGADGLSGSTSRYDDEGIKFVSTTAGVTFDVRDLVSGVQRGDKFNIVQLGTSGNDSIFGGGLKGEAFYFNAGMGDDRVTGGLGNDFLVGGGGNDVLNGRDGNDSFIGGAGNDTIFGGIGDDTAIVTLATDGNDLVDLGAGMDTVNVTAPATAGQIRLTFTSAEVGNAAANDSATMTNQDGGLAVRMLAEDGAGGLSALGGRYDDEGISFVSTTPGVTFDVRDLVSGVQRGDQFNIVRLGTEAADTYDETGKTESIYINAGMGDDKVTGGLGNDFLVGGAGNDTLAGREGTNSYIGGAGSDTFVFTTTASNDTINDFVSGTDKIDLRAFNIGATNVASTTVGANTVLGIDADANGSVDFNITLVNAARPADSDFLFA